MTPPAPSHRLSPDGRLLGRPTALELEQGREIRALIKAFSQRADAAQDSADELSWRRAQAWLVAAANAVDGGGDHRVRVELTAAEGRAITAYMNTLVEGSSLGYAWRRGLTYIDLTAGYCDLVSTHKTAGLDVAEAIDWAANVTASEAALLASARAKIRAHGHNARHDKDRIDR